MDQDQELKRAKWLLGAAGFFLISTFMAFDEFRYVLWGRQVEGRISQVKQVRMPGKRGSDQPMLSVEYSFNDDARGSFNERDLVPVNWQLPQNGQVPIQYIPGSPDSSRLAGHRNTMWLVIFLISLGVMALFLFKLYLEAKEPVKRRQARRAI